MSQNEGQENSSDDSTIDESDHDDQQEAETQESLLVARKDRMATAQTQYQYNIDSKTATAIEGKKVATTQQESQVSEGGRKRRREYDEIDVPRVKSPMRGSKSVRKRNINKKSNMQSAQSDDGRRAEDGDEPTDEEDDDSDAPLVSEETKHFLRHRIPWPKTGICRRLVHLSHVLSLSNALMFPHLCARYGGVAFLIAYIIAYFFVGIPVLCAEMALGQFSSMPPVELFRKMSPSLSGIGVVMLAILTIKSIYISGVASQAFLSAIYTVTQGMGASEPAWSNCNFTGIHPQLCFKYEYEHCYRQIADPQEIEMPINATCMDWVHGMAFIYNHTKNSQRWRYWRPPHLDYMSANVFKPIYHHSEWEFPMWTTPVLAFVWTFTAFLSWIGVRRLGNAFVALKVVIFLGFIGNLFLSLASAHEEANFLDFFDADLSPLANLEIWSDAISHVIGSLNLGSGAVHTISSFSQFSENFLYNGLLIAGVDIIFSFIIGLTFLTSVSSVASRIFPGDEPRHRLKYMFTHGFVVTQTMFPEHISWSIPSYGWIFGALHYIKIGLLGIPSSVVSVGIIRHAIEEVLSRFISRSSFVKKEKVFQGIICAIFSLFGALVGIVLVGPSGFMLGKLWHEFSGVSLLIITLSEILSLCFHYGFRRYLANVQAMLHQTGKRAHAFYTFTTVWYYFFTPAFILMAMGFKIYKNRHTRVLEYIFPADFELYGWSIVGCAAILVFAPMLRYVITFACRTRTAGQAFEPLPSWGPINERDYSKNMKMERAAWVKTA